MKKTLHVFLTFVSLIAFTAVSAAAQSASWRQVVGIILAGNVVGSGTGAVPGGFLPWTTTAGAARVNLHNGEVQFSVRGLVFAAGAPGITSCSRIAARVWHPGRRGCLPSTDEFWRRGPFDLVKRDDRRIRQPRTVPLAGPRPGWRRAGVP